jgi:hypothetical protein
MVHCTREKVARQVEVELKELNQSTGLPFRELLSGAKISAALERAGIDFRERVYSPLVTLWAFLSQVTSNDSSCQNAVSRVLADRVAHGHKACSTDTSSYCEARGRLPEQVVRDLALETGQDLHRQAPEEWLWKGRRVQIVDGSTLSMADTESNQHEYPQSSGQKAGLGFPILRFVALLSLSCGAVLECALGPCKGKGTGELSLFRQLWHALKAGEILLGDRLYDSYRDIAELKSRGVDCVFGKKQSRKGGFRVRRHLGPNDRIVTWKRPKYNPKRFDSREQWESLPKTIDMREVCVTVQRPGCRPRTVVIVTTLLDEKQYSADDLMKLFAERWNCELDLRTIKRALGMYHSRCETPEMVRKDLWMHLLAYNLVRVRMAQAARMNDVQPRKLSFTAAKNHIENFAPYLATASGAEHQRIERVMLDAIARCRVGKRPGRVEPRAVKKRQQKYPYLTKPRTQARKRLAA